VAAALTGQLTGQPPHAGRSWLAGLDARLRDHEWTTVIKTVDGDPDRIDALVYSRVWPDFSGDALLVRSETEACAVRLDPAGRPVWECSGSARQVVDQLLLLPVPPGRAASDVDGRPG
jgi:hypothetical protein